MIQLIVVGDVHATVAELTECEKLFAFWLELHQLYPDATFVFLGDQTDTNDVLSVRVMSFWLRVASALPCIFLVGNHDQVHPGSDLHAMAALEGKARVVGDAWQWGPISMVAYCSDREQFTQRAGQRSGLLICHQDLAGSLYDDGVTHSRSTLEAPLSFAQVISGHLHIPQEKGRIWYPGAPRWRRKSDAAAVDRAVWWVAIDDTGRIAKRRSHSTAAVCRRLVSLKDAADRPALLVRGADNRVEVRGSADYVERRRRELVAEGAIVSAVIEAVKPPAVKESDGLEESMRQHLAGWTSPNGTPPDRLRELISKKMGIEL